jgi:hypothetical protein
MLLLGINLFAMELYPVRIVNNIYLYSIIATVASNSERNDAKSFLDSVRGMAPSFHMREAIDKRSINLNDFLSAFLAVALIWMIFFVLSIFCWLYQCSSCTCQNYCPPCKSCRRDVSENPYTKWELLVPIGFLILFNLLIFCVSIAGLVTFFIYLSLKVYAPSVERGIKAVRCSFIATLNDIAEPSPAFSGLRGISDSLKGIQSQLDGLTKSIGDTFKPPANSDILKNEMQTVANGAPSSTLKE